MKLIILTCFLLVASASLAGCDQEPRRGAAAGKVTETPGHGPSSTERDTPGDLQTPASDDVKKLSSTSSLEEGGDFEALLESAAAEAEVDLLKIPVNDTESAASALESEDKITERQAFVSGPNLNPDRLGFAFPHIHHHLPPIHHPPIPRPPPIPKRRPPPLPPIPDHHHDFPPPDFDFDPPDFFENAGLPPPGDEPFGFGAPFETHEHEHDPFFSPHLDDDFPPHDEHFPHDLDLHRTTCLSRRPTTRGTGSTRDSRRRESRASILRSSHSSRSRRDRTLTRKVDLGSRGKCLVFQPPLRKMESPISSLL
ncbi:hypothetical protein C7M84_000904 [Penaeus vannamei]|uniref:Uncharacterized protein n=1 Tax=Penaeus vannamei TaxID=6689 RepID=A0A423TV67_PENVA|nr:hypothetical protein C7M84_000904 [Penaeus vannamei]